MVRLLANENIPSVAVRLLRKQNVDITSATETRPGMKDDQVLQLANEQGRLLFTFDKDFGEYAFRLKARTRGIVLLRFVPRSPEHVARRIQDLISRQLARPDYFVIAEEDRGRVVRLEGS